jgi:hypothetical protein
LQQANAVLGLILIAIGFFFYFLPSIIGRKKRNARAIIVVNILLGWTVLGWIAALTWAMTNDAPTQIVIPVAPFSKPVLCPNCGRYSASGSQFCTLCGRSFYAEPTGTKSHNFPA